MKSANMWECECGHIEYGEFPPEECKKCWQLDSFLEVPEDLIDEKKDKILEIIKTVSGEADFEEEDNIGDIEEIEDEAPVKTSKKTKKSKVKTTKKARKKK